MSESAWDGAGSKEGLEIWRIEDKDHVSKIPEAEYGEFYTGNTYIILHTRVKPSTGDLECNIHFWLGQSTTPKDESNLVMKTMELDEILGGARVKYRECQGNESPLLVSLFKRGIRYIPGTRQSCPDSTDGSILDNVKLYHVKGRRNVRVQEVEVSVRSMNKGDCFILDTPTKIWVYLGRYSKRVEKVKAVQAANQIRDQYHSGDVNEVEVVDMKSAQNIVDDFFHALGGGSRAEVADPPSEDDDASFEEGTKVSTVTLYRVSDLDGEVKIVQVGVNSLTVEMLNSADCFILDATVQAEIYVWIGNSCTQQEKAEAFAGAGKFLVEKGHPPSTQIQCIVDGREPSSFKQFFSSWTKSLLATATPAYGKDYAASTRGRITAKLSKNPSVATIATAKKHAKLLKNLGTCLSFSPDDGTGKVELWRVENFELAPVPEATFGLFFGGDSYVLKYSYGDETVGDDGYVIYYWQGKQSSQDEKASSALHAVKLDEELLLRATLIRVQQGYEPAHFLRIFKGRIVIFLGGHASGFKNLRENDTYDPKQARLFHVKSTCREDTRAVQVELKASSLDSDDVFILDGSKECPRDYIWIGRNASDFEKQMGQEILHLVSSGDDENAQVLFKVNEGEEPQEFLELLGEKGPYTVELAETVDMIQGGPSTLRPRLFHCSIPEGSSSKLKVEEVFNFTQEELYEDDVMVLDTGGDEIFVWLGHGATQQERTYSTRMADDYIQGNYARCGGVFVAVSIVIKQNYEPDAFKEFFLTWDNHYWKRLAELGK